MAVYGLDTYSLGTSSSQIDATLNAIVNNSPNTISFICRYYCANTSAGKILTLSEAQKISNKGMKIISIYQDANDKAEYFSKAWGESDAEDAYTYAKNTIGQPKNSAIYFAVDFDATATEVTNNIIPYFEAIKKKFSESYNDYYKIGVYGSGAVCQKIKQDLSLASYSWLAQSTGYRGTSAYNSASKYNIKQGMEYPEYNNITFDDNIRGNATTYGQWSL